MTEITQTSRQILIVAMYDNDYSRSAASWLPFTGCGIITTFHGCATFCLSYNVYWRI